jgi:hypothetical protein
MNILTPLIDKYVSPKLFGGAKKWKTIWLLNLEQFCA